MAVNIDQSSPLPFSISIEMVQRSFPNGSKGRPNGLLLQHLKDLTGCTARNGGVSHLSSIVDLLTLTLEGRTPQPFVHYFFGANLTTLRKKSGGIFPIAVESTIRRLASKCTCLHALESIQHLLSPNQLDFGVPGGAEAAVHATQLYLNHLPAHKALLKIDFRNAFTVNLEIFVVKIFS